MLFKNIVSFSLLALYAGISGAIPLSSNEKRAAKSTESGIITGGPSDTLLTYGLATCPGIAASGTAGPNPGQTIDKVLTHIQCDPDGSTAEEQAQQWAAAVSTSGMTVNKMVVYILNPALVPAPAYQAQVNINNAACIAAASLGSYEVAYRQSVAAPSPTDQLMVNLDGSITAGTVTY